MRQLSLISLIIVNAHAAFSQWQEIKQVKVDGIQLYDQDQMGNIYVANAEGTVMKFSQSGEKLLDYSPVRITRVDELKVTTQLKVALFYEGMQELVMLNRWFGDPIQYRLSDFNLGFVTAVSPTPQQTVWVVDLTDFSLKLLDANRAQVLEEKSLAQVLDQKTADVDFFKTQENRMFLVSGNMMLVFDNLGNYLESIPLGKMGKPRFYRSSFYGKLAGRMIITDIYSGEKKEIDLPKDSGSDILFNGSRLVSFSQGGFVVYKYLSSE